MELTTTAYGTWSGGRYMHFGVTLDEDRFLSCIRHAYDEGIRTFITADVYGAGKADQALARALQGVDRSTYCLVGMIGHDFINGKREGSRGFPRLTDPRLRGPEEYGEFIEEATLSSLKDCGTDYFDLLMLHNPDELGYTHEKVWEGMAAMKSKGLAQQIGIAPGPANGFTLDLAQTYETYAEVIDWSMVILNPFEPWPVGKVAPIAAANDIKLITRVADYGGIFHDDLRPGHEFAPGDHRAYRPEGWVEAGYEKLEKMRPIAEKYGLTMLQFAAIVNLSHPAVECVVPTFVQETGDGARPIEDKIAEYSMLPADVRLSDEDLALVLEIGDNTGCMSLKGASKRHEVSERPDEWPMREDLLVVAEKHNLGTDW